VALVRQAMGQTLRRRRQVQQRTLREVSRTARVSLGYLSEVERGQKEASSELLAAICAALALPLSALMSEVGAVLAADEATAAGVAVIGPALTTAPSGPLGAVDRAA
jgi:transcriptional regulator with XRE-family HTH domain